MPSVVSVDVRPNFDVIHRVKSIRSVFAVLTKTLNVASHLLLLVTATITRSFRSCHFERRTALAYGPGGARRVGEKIEMAADRSYFNKGRSLNCLLCHTVESTIPEWPSNWSA